MDTPEPDSLLDEQVINEIHRVRARSGRAQALRGAVAVWTSGTAFVLALLVLAGGLLLGWLHRANIESVNSALFVVAGAGAVLLVVALLAHVLSRSPGYLMAGKWGNLRGHYLRAFPEESAEAVHREQESETDTERTGALEAIVRERSRVSRRGAK
ncbi:hypothetical protein ACTXKH_19170 [Brachybacterium tyrofermentans]|uniref:hypothetical protein n=1 Tax=Brachybacterium tyrofermentans TaxID=47848 RepID=UPI003FD4ED63